MLNYCQQMIISPKKWKAPLQIRFRNEVSHIFSNFVKTLQFHRAHAGDGYKGI